MRPTLRCLRDDLQLELPSRDVALDVLSHPVLDKARKLAPSFPNNQIRIEEIADTMVYRFTHGRYRVADWDDEERSIWVCASDIRRAGARDDAYEYIIDLHWADELLPSDLDDQRYEAEAAQRLLSAIRHGAPQWVADARAHAGGERDHALPGGAVIHLYIREQDGYEEVWLAMPTVTGKVVGLPPRVRGILASEVERAVGAAIWDDVYDWPTRQLYSYEVARFGLR